MPWYSPSAFLTENVKKRVGVYLIQHYLGQFLETKLTADQLSVDLTKGIGTIENVSLDMEALKELANKQNLPVEFVSGYIGKLTFYVPWTSFLRDPTNIEVHGLKITVQAKQRVECATSMFESMWSSMTNSMQLAEECLKQDTEAVDNSQPLEGLEVIAQAIESILCRVKVKFVNTTFQFECLPKDSLTGVALIATIDSIEYTDESGEDPPSSESSDKGEQNKAYIVSSFTTKNFTLEGIAFATQEFTCSSRYAADGSESQYSQDDSLVTHVIQETIEGSSHTPTEENESKHTAQETHRIRDKFADRDSPLQNVLLFAKIIGKQVIRIRLKQSEMVSGPKVSIEMTFGALNVFLSPRQVYDLIEIASGLFGEPGEDLSSTTPKQKCTEKPMTGLDYQRVEQELQCQLNPAMFAAPGLQGAHGWSTAQLEESDTDDNFLPMHSRGEHGGDAMFDSTYSNASSSMESSLSSSMASSLSEATTNRTRRKFNSIQSDPTAEISHFHIRIASLVIVLLHEDILTMTNEAGAPGLIASSVKQMQSTAEHFFATLANLVPAGYGPRNFDDAKTTFEKACAKRHLRLIAAPIQIECHETTTSSAFSISGELTTAKLELLECLVKDNVKFDYVKLLYFKDDANIASPVHSKPCMKMSFRHVEKTRRGGIGRKVYIPKTDLHFTLDTCILDVDITIIDRLSALLNPPTVIHKPQNVWATQSCKDTLGAKPEAVMDIKLTAHSLLLKLRIPIPDFRPANDLQRVPWWERNVRNAFITGKLSHVLAQTSINSNVETQAYTIQCRTLDLYYHENETAAPLHIGKSTVDDSSSSCMPTVTIKVNPLVKLDVEVEETMDQDGVMTMSCGTIIPPQRQGPFSSKRVIHESDTPHARTTPADDENAELVLPGTKAEMADFIRTTIGSTRIHLDFNFPTASVQFLSKHIFEVLYNHILSDLLLWEPCAPVSKCADSSAVPTAMFESFDRMETYATCKSGNKYESDSDDSEDFDAQNSALFYSAYDIRHKPAKKQQQVKRKCQSYLTLNLRIGKGLIRMCPPVRDVDGNVIPEQIAEFLLGVDEASLFTVSGYNGDENLGYVCVQSKGAQLHHSDMISSTSQNSQLKEIGGALGRHLCPTIYKSENGILETTENRAGDREMLSVAVRIQANHETHHVKLVRVALGLNKATLRHRMCPVPNIWITQLIDLFKVNDYTIPGFHAKDVLTEMHLHLWDCAIDYRPRHLPLRSVITMGQLSMSSHLTTTANTTTLRFIAEDCNLFLSDKLPPRKGIPSLAPVELKRDYVGIIDVGLIEISLKINDIALPHCDLRALVNKFMIHTCADSARALMELITYIATNGDLNDQEQLVNVNYASPKRHVEQELIAVETQDISNLSKSQHQQVNDMLVDAMKESVQVPRARDTPMTGAKLFFFPDEGQPLPESMKPLPQVTTDLGDVTFRSNRSSDTDEDFIFIGDEAGVGLMPKNGLPQIRWLIDDSLRLVDNHFAIPVGKTDVLKAPKDFPTPVMRYTLCEMTVQWKLYAGRDFRSVDDGKTEKKSVNFIDGQNAVLYTNRNTGEISFQSKSHKNQKKSKANWIERGGVHRDHDIVIDIQLNKVRVQHDIYPEHTIQASRQVIVISQIEIHDRLVSSRIKKLLYLDSTDIRPRQTHANMLTIKLIHIRPDLKLKAEECILVLGLLPLRINLDQDTLLFILNFATDMIADNTKVEDMATNSKTNTPTHHPPVMTIASDEVMDDLEAKKLVDDNLILLLDDVKDKVECAKVEKSVPTTSSSTDSATPIYFRKVTFVNPVPIRLDYHSKGNFDWKHGPIAALVIGIASLNYVEFTLKRLENNHGILGFDKLIQYFAQEWKNDIKRNQIHTVLSGVGPIHSLVQLFQGVRDLIWMPIEQYQKDGRIVRGLQRGANSFTTSTAMAALELTNRFINLIQLTAETAYDMMSPGPSVRRALAIKAKGRKKRYNQPQDLREGVANAYNVVKEGIGETAENIVRVASIEKEQKGITGAVGGVLRQIPTTMIKPIIIASEATSNVLGGMQCQLLPDAKREANEKWKNDGDL